MPLLPLYLDLLRLEDERIQHIPPNNGLRIQTPHSPQTISGIVYPETKLYPPHHIRGTKGYWAIEHFQQAMGATLLRNGQPAPLP
ncbi:hypothetical protein DUZ99_12155 [Xylanibacillus composti]|uniref:hypothetical protein n=1 Tax=Xylanibacillus composti TaxID=1572762 RepID=UPI001BD1421D|nr:hypothetical protein [Xylanibacillus composti]MDT9725727.1 hypothetical protein [Xylanibacillus composti]